MQMNNVNSRIYHFFFATLLLFFTSYSLACGGHLHLRVNAQLSSTAAHAEIGTVIYKVEGTLSSLASSQIEIQCDQGPNSTAQHASLISLGRMLGVSTGKGIYATNLPGIGIRVSVAKRSSQGVQWQQLPFSSRDKFVSSFSSSDIFLRLELVRTGGAMGHGIIYFHEDNILLFKPVGINSPTIVDITVIGNLSAGTCQIMTDTINVAMGTSGINELKAGAGVTGSAHRFAVPIQCQNVKNVFFSIHGEVSGSSETILSLLSGSDSAKGVGIQIFYNGSPVRIGQPINVSSDFTQRETKGIFLSARYVSTGTKISAGKVNCVATIRIDYI